MPHPSRANPLCCPEYDKPCFAAFGKDMFDRFKYSLFYVFVATRTYHYDENSVTRPWHATGYNVHGVRNGRQSLFYQSLSSA